MDKFKLLDQHREILERKLIEQKPQKLYPIMLKYISGQLKTIERNSVESIIVKLRPNDLKHVSKMEENICVVLIHMNPGLLLSKDIWLEDKNFQRTMIYTCDRNIELNKIKKLLMLIMQYHDEDILKDVYSVFGDRILLLLFDLFKDSDYYEEKRFENLMPVLLCNENITVDNLERIPSKNDREKLFLKINTYSSELIHTKNKQVWIEIYKDLFFDSNNKLKLALQFMPIILNTSYCFENDFIKNTVGVIYQQLKNNELNFDDWNRFQHMLPQVEMCYSWDKCLRIRKALEERKYDISLVTN